MGALGSERKGSESRAQKLPKFVTTTQKLGRALLNAAAKGAPRQVLENVGLNERAGSSS